MTFVRSGPGPRARWRSPALVASLLVLLLWAEGAGAWVPSAGVVASQLARANRAAGRSHSLVLSVALRDGRDRVVARGELRSDPAGMARLEIEGGSGRVERHLVRGGEHLAASGGTLLAQPAPYLPPLFFLQAGSATPVLSSLASLGGSSETVLGRHEGEVCWVLGGRDLAPPANESAAQYGTPGRKAALWITREGSRLVRVDRLDGTRFWLGPEETFAGVVLPKWIRIERPGVPPARLEILDARRARFDVPDTFGVDWLLGR